MPLYTTKRALIEWLLLAAAAAFILGFCWTDAHCQNVVSPLYPGSSWNHVPPATWPPTDSNGAVVPISNFRIWTSGQSWLQIETSSGTYVWTGMDDIVNTLLPAGQPVMSAIYTFGATPKWAGTCPAAADPSACLPGPTGSGFGGGTQCSNSNDYSCLPPSDVNSDGSGTDAQFATFVATLAGRYANKIAYYEAYNEADSPNYWCPGGGATGCPSTLQQSQNMMVRMMWDARKIIHCLSPSSQMVGPALHSASALVWGHEYAITSISAPAGVAGVNGVPAGCNWPAQTVTGAMTFDVTNFHDHFSTPDAPFIGTYNNVATEIANDSLPTALFEDEWGCTACGTVDAQAAYYGAGLAIRAAVGPPYLLLTGQAQWDNSTYPMQGTVAGLGFNTVAGWLRGATVGSYAHSGNIYTVPVTTRSGFSGVIAWDTSQSATCGTGCPTHTFGAQYGLWTDLTGTVRSTTSGGTAPLGLKPIFLLPAPTAPSAPSLNGEVVVTGQAILNQGPGTIPASLFGLHFRFNENVQEYGAPCPTLVLKYPNLPYGSLRLWDTDTRWQNLNLSSGVFNFACLDPYLALARTAGVTDLIMTLSSTPNWAASDPSVNDCDYAFFQLGDCSPPSDLNSDGTGTNQHWRDYMYNLGTHIAGLSPATYMVPTYFEMWNEFTRGSGTDCTESAAQQSWLGTCEQLVRMAQDANCILTGRPITITATSTTCTAGNMNEPAVGLLPQARIVTPNAGSNSTVDIDLWGAYLATTGALLNVDRLAVHAYAYQGLGTTVPDGSSYAGSAVGLPAQYAVAEGLLPGTAFGKTLWSTEGSWGSTPQNLPDANMDEGYVARYYLAGWSSGFRELYWYAVNNSYGTLINQNGVNGCNDGGTQLGCPTLAATGWTSTYNWMVGNKISTPCAPAAGTSVAITWTAVGGATYYNVERSPNSGGPYTILGTSSSNSYLDTTVSNGQTYYYVAEACNGSGCSGFSNVQQVITPGLPGNWWQCGLLTAAAVKQLAVWDASQGSSSVTVNVKTSGGVCAVGAPCVQATSMNGAALSSASNWSTVPIPVGSYVQFSSSLLAPTHYFAVTGYATITTPNDTLVLSDTLNFLAVHTGVATEAFSYSFFAYPNNFVKYYTLDSGTAKSFVGTTVPIGFKPILLSQ